MLRTFGWALGALVAVLSLSAPASASPAAETTYLTLATPVALPGVTLAPGTYIFERADENKPDVVRILSADRQKVFLTKHTITVARPAHLDDEQPLTVAEAAAGTAPRVLTWFALGADDGHAFIYPKH